ncbi:hypothetical protein [Gluconobacter roseus]|uniref:hypothetical protein n=1 Tax=Gluconobacter roseus TaxID=586239 RepID=UPI0038D00D8A
MRKASSEDSGLKNSERTLPYMPDAGDMERLFLLKLIYRPKDAYSGYFEVFYFSKNNPMAVPVYRAQKTRPFLAGFSVVRKG